MATLNKAMPSPRFEDKALKWYEGDVFMMYVNIKIVDADDEPISFKDDDKFIFEIKNDKKNQLFDMEFGKKSVTVKDDINVLTFVMTEEYTLRMGAGTYYYDIVFAHADTKTTISRLNKIVVE